MSVYNAEKYVAEAIQSILNQSFKNFELIIVDDASTDGSNEIIQRFVKLDKRLICFKNKANKYAAVSRNFGIKKAKGKYVAIMDADDISSLNRLKKQFNFLEKNKDIFLVGSLAKHINEKGKKIGVSKIPIKNKIIKDFLLKDNPIYNSSIMFRNDKTFIYREKIFYCEDYDAFLLLDSKGKKIENLDEYLINYRILSTSISRSKRVKQALFMHKAQEFYEQRLSEGLDYYGEFDPKEFLEIDLLEKKSSKKDLIFVVTNSLKYYSDLQFYSKKLIKYYGFFNPFLLFYLLTFGGKNNFEFIIKSIQKIKLFIGLYRK